ncbi:hypothetical protein PAHAL_2G172500 [Panicum hallii]|jgi:hypothetical protein|uniref:Uncharacterized protein n=1 Tax=Panicum hallii TaxID=206008 RepID=A0A2T8KPI6_9POAL|nr:hypothetical protein PAHAL_2G172500 [Panicum hallii]
MTEATLIRFLYVMPMLTSLPFHVLMTTMNHNNEKLQQSFDFLGIRQVLIALGYI